MSEVATKFKLIGVAQLLEITGWSITTLDRRVKSGEFPGPVDGKARGSSRKWTLAQYEAWAKRKMDEADTEAA